MQMGGGMHHGQDGGHLGAIGQHVGVEGHGGPGIHDRGGGGGGGGTYSLNHLVELLQCKEMALLLP